MMRIKTLALGVSLFFVAASAFAQENLLEIYQRAVQNDPTIREAEATYQANAQVRPLARSQLLPSLQLGASTTSSDVTDPNPPTNYVTGEAVAGFTGRNSTRSSDSFSINVSQTVFNWAQIVTLKQADKLVARAEIEYESAKQDLMTRVSAAYFNVLAAQDTLAAQVAAREALAQQLEQAQRRFEVGLIAITEVQETRAGYDNAVAQEILAQQSLATAEEQLREIIGERVSNLAVPSSDLPLEPPDPDSADMWVDAALEQNPELIAARITAQAAEDDITISRAQRLPTLSFSTGYTDSTTNASSRLLGPAGGFTNRSISGSQGYNWSLDLRVPLFNGGGISAQVQQNVYRHRAAIENADRIARQTERATRDAYLGVISSIASVRALRQALESAETALRAGEAGLEVGTRTAVDVIILQENLRQAQTNYAQSRYDYIINLLALKQATGSLTIEDIQQVNGWLTGQPGTTLTPGAAGSNSSQSSNSTN